MSFRKMSHSVLFTIWILCVLTLHAAAQSSSSSSSTGSAGPLNPSNGLPPVITRVTGCTDQGVGTVNCPKPTFLTIHGTGFMTGLEYEKYPLSSLSVVLELPEFDPPIQCSPYYQSPVNDTYFQCYIFDRGFGTMPTGVMISIIINNKITKDQTPPFAAFSFKDEPAPVVSGVTGCRSNSPDGHTTYNCDLISDTVTLLGSGFTSIDHYSIGLWLGTDASTSTILNLGFASTLVVRYSDTEIVFSFADDYQLLSAIDAQEGKPMPLSIRDFASPPKWAVDTVWVQFTDLPSPVITGFAAFGWVDDGCTFNNVTSRFTNCVSGLSSVTVQGRYFFEGSEVYVGNLKATTAWGTASTSITFTMPIAEFVEGVYYDVQVKTVAGSVTSPAVIEFNTDPIITNVIPCVDNGMLTSPGYFSAKCMPGEKLVLSTLYVKTTAAPRVVFQGYSNASLSIDCRDAVTLSKNTVQCTMPDPPANVPSWQLQTLRVFIEWASGEKSNQVTVSQMFEPANAPRLSSITGCYSNSGDPLHANQCLGNPDSPIILTLTGVRLSQLNWTITVNSWMVCDKLFIVSDQQVTCALAPLDSFMAFNIKYAVVLTGYTQTVLLESNAAYITFVDKITYDSTSSSSSSTTTIVLATVFSIVGAVLLVAAIVVISRRVSQSKQRNSEMAPEFSTTSSRHVELSEI